MHGVWDSQKCPVYQVSLLQDVPNKRFGTVKCVLFIYQVSSLQDVPNKRFGTVKCVLFIYQVSSLQDVMNKVFDLGQSNVSCLSGVLIAGCPE